MGNENEVQSICPVCNTLSGFSLFSTAIRPLISGLPTVNKAKTLRCSSCKKATYCSAECQRKVSSFQKTANSKLLTGGDGRNGQDWKSHKPGCRMDKALADQSESEAFAKPIISLDLMDRIVKFLEHHQVAFSVAINTFFSLTNSCGSPDSIRTHLLVLEFDYNSSSRTNFDLLILDKCYLQSRTDFLLTPVGKSNCIEVNDVLDHKPKDCLGNPARVAHLLKSKQEGGEPVLLRIVSWILYPSSGKVRNYTSQAVSKSLHWALKGPVCLTHFEASYRSSLREARWGIKPRGKSSDRSSQQ
jgi:hypothetical protein